MKHPDIDAGQRFPNDPSVIAAQQARGWVLHTMPKAFDDDARHRGDRAVRGDLLLRAGSDRR